MKVKIPEIGEAVEFPDEVNGNVHKALHRSGRTDIYTSGFDDEDFPRLNGDILVDSEMARIIKKETGFDCWHTLNNIRVIDVSDSNGENEIIEPRGAK